MTPWRSASRELAVAAGLVTALAATAWVIYGPTNSSIIVLVCAGFSLVALRTLIGRPDEPPDEPDAPYDGPTTSFTGFWRTQTNLADATASMSAWDFHIRLQLQNLLAARLAEHHAISLTGDPEAARAAFIGAADDSGGAAGARGRAELWYWIDPLRPSPPDASSRTGIPPRALAALIYRLEQL